jgi:lipopolysaccharide transport system ATP-binding protein
MSDTIISVEGLGKKYVLSHQGERGGYSRFSERLEDMVKRPLSFGKRLFRGDGRSKIGDGGADGSPSSNSHLPSAASKEEFWALKDVSFEVKRGEVVGIIGRNGAGKSTLLKILSRITEPTEGRVTLRGRVASLLEVGTGFHPELTGRENIFLNGAILGMTKAEIKKKFDEIVAFAEVERFLDTPVKRYSSGMYVRLAFAVAAHLEPEILVVDEVLAVGDAEFQKKCLGKMKDVATGGRTVLFVSHNMTAVQNLCETCLWLKNGKIVEKNLPIETITKYLAESAKRNGSLGQVLYESPKFSIKKIKINQSETPTVLAGQTCRFEMEYTCSQPESLKGGVRISLTLRLNDEKIANLWSACYPEVRIQPRQNGKIECALATWPFREATFTLDVYVDDETGQTIEYVRNAITLESRDGDFFRGGKNLPIGEGILFLEQNWVHH